MGLAAGLLALILLSDSRPSIAVLASAASLLSIALLAAVAFLPSQQKRLHQELVRRQRRLATLCEGTSLPNLKDVKQLQTELELTDAEAEPSFKTVRNRVIESFKTEIESMANPDLKYIERRQTELELTDPEVQSFLNPVRDRVIEAFRTEIRNPALDRVGVLKLFERPAQLGLQDRDVEKEYEYLQALADVKALAERFELSHSLPIVAGYESKLGNDICHFARTVYVEKHGPDETGTLLLTDREAIFIGKTLFRFLWKQTAEISSGYRTMTIVRHDRQNPYIFHFTNWSGALVATFIAVKVSEKAKQRNLQTIAP